jgi:hypothetical protein
MFSLCSPLLQSFGTIGSLLVRQVYGFSSFYGLPKANETPYFVAKAWLRHFATTRESGGLVGLSEVSVGL